MLRKPNPSLIVGKLFKKFESFRTKPNKVTHGSKGREIFKFDSTVPAKAPKTKKELLDLRNYSYQHLIALVITQWLSFTPKDFVGINGISNDGWQHNYSPPKYDP